MKVGTKTKRAWQRLGSLPVCPAAISLLVALAWTATAARAGDLPHAPASFAARNLPFAIADFDGDHQPDLASIETGKARSSLDGDYWIQLRLSKSGPQWIRLVAPLGGLMIEARDVNGDAAIDLVLATAWLRQPVAVLLNDGRGGFSRQSPALFRVAFSDSKGQVFQLPSGAVDAVGISPESASALQQPALDHGGLNPSAGPWALQSPLVISQFLLSCNPGRAPPCNNLQS